MVLALRTIGTDIVLEQLHSVTAVHFKLWISLTRLSKLYRSCNKEKVVSLTINPAKFRFGFTLFNNSLKSLYYIGETIDFVAMLSWVHVLISTYMIDFVAISNKCQTFWTYMLKNVLLNKLFWTTNKHWNFSKSHTLVLNI